MHLGKVLLAATASISILTGVFAQRGSKSLPIETFAHAQASDFVGEAKCAECHTSTVKRFLDSPHALYVAKVGGCEACHGPGKQHADAGDGSHILSFTAMKPREIVDACLRCHGDLMKKPHFANDVHGRGGLSCVACHQIHPHAVDNPAAGDKQVVKDVYAATKTSNPLLKAPEPVLCAMCHQQELAAFRKNTHHPIPEGRMTCSDCHSIHPTNADRLKIGTVKEKCVTCHADVAGPFAFEHDPVAGWTGGGCMECHDPHGSHNPNLLKSFSRGLCSQCHTDMGGGNHHPGLSCWAAGCHVAVHGSNHDPRLLSR